MKLQFEIGKAFPKNNILAKWVVGLSVITNDVIMVNSYLKNAFKEGTSNVPKEALYFLRLTCSHYREAAKFIEVGKEYPEISNFIKGLSSEAQNDFETVCSTFSPWKKSFVQKLIRPIRDNLFHYPKIDEPEFENILNEIGLCKSYVYSPSGLLKDKRAVFADEFINAYSFSHFEDNIEMLNDTFRKLGSAICALNRFCDEVLGRYLYQLPKGIVEVIK